MRHVISFDSTLQKELQVKLRGTHTPANTLVKSSTLVPESGNVGVSGADENVRRNCRCHDLQ